MTNAQPAVIDTSPARQPLTVIEKSGLPYRRQAYSVATSVLAADDSAVVTAIRAIASGSTAIVDPGLKPNQPSQRIIPPGKT